MDLMFATDNQKKFNKRLEAGRCFGMCLDWAKQSLTLGGVNYAGALTEAKWDFYQSRYEISVCGKGTALQQHEKVITDAGIKITNGKGASVSPITSGTVVKELEKVNGTCIWVVTGPGGGHAMGFRQVLGSVEFFDPNDGLYKCKSISGMKVDVANELDTYYSNLLGTMMVFQLKL